MSKTKRNSLVLLCVAGLLVLLLAMSLSSLGLADGTPFTLDNSDVTLPGVSDSIPGSAAIGWLVRGLIALSLLLLPVYIIYSMLSAEGRRRLVVNVVVLVAMMGIAAYLSEYSIGGDEQEAEMMGGSSSEDEEVAPEPAPSTLDASEPPAWLVIAFIGVASAIGVGLLVVGLWVYQQHIDRAGASLRPLAAAAQETLDSLQAGGDFASAITRCYYDMNRIVKEHRGISRDAAMTPREFETYLTSRGLPGGAVETLTRLFEQVRYGSVTPRPGDEALALASLTEIVTACHPPRGDSGEH